MSVAGVKFYMFATQAAAQACVSQIDARARQLASIINRVDASGNIIGVRESDRAAQPQAVTTTWCIAKQNAFGQWCVLHPQYASAASDPAPGQPSGTTVLQYVSQDCAAYTIGTDDGSWWPEVVIT